MTESKRHELNRQRLEKIHSSIRGNVKALLASMEFYGHRPLIHSLVWRSEAEQTRLYKLGRTEVRYGYHNVTGRHGEPESLAADIVDANKAWGASRAFWLTLGYCANAQGLGWGGYFGLARRSRARLENLVSKPPTKWPPLSSLHSLKLGWDVAHVQTRRVSIAHAKKGMR